jgi:hypothetical protein
MSTFNYPGYSTTNPLQVAVVSGGGSSGGLTNTELRATPVPVTSVLTAGETHIGQIGGTVAVITPTVTVDANIYASGDNFGGKLTLTGMTRIAAGSGMIQSAVITSKALQTFTADVIFFNADPSASTFTTNVAQALDDADLAKVIGVAQCNTVIALTDCSIHQATNLALPFRLASGTTAYAAIVVRGTPTPATTSDIQLSIRVLQD